MVLGASGLRVLRFWGLGSRALGLGSLGVLGFSVNLRKKSNTTSRRCDRTEGCETALLATILVTGMLSITVRGTRLIMLPFCTDGNDGKVAIIIIITIIFITAVKVATPANGNITS